MAPVRTSESSPGTPAAAGLATLTKPGTQDADAGPVTLTDRAIAYVKARRLKMGKPDAALRVGVRGGGCEGLTYVTDFTEEPPRERDIVIDHGDIRVYVDSRSVRYLDGSVIDAQSTLMYQGLKFDNPNQASACGCGATFSVKS